MDLPSGIVWEIPRIYSFFCSLTAWPSSCYGYSSLLEGIVFDILWYIRLPNWNRWRVMAPRHY